MDPLVVMIAAIVRTAEEECVPSVGEEGKIGREGPLGFRQVLRRETKLSRKML